MGVKENPVASGVMGPVLAIAPKVLTRKSLRREAHLSEKSSESPNYKPLPYVTTPYVSMMPTQYTR